MQVKMIFDVDDTISTNFRRLDYSKCIPRKDVIEKINYLHDILEYKIVLYTSRGMVSCNGDIEKINKKNYATLSKWLFDNNVHYDELIFGKPLGDMYIDDKAMNVNEFLRSDFSHMKGGSGSKIERIGYLVKKDLKTKDECEMFKDWNDDNKGYCKAPKVISYLYNEVYIEFIDGDLLSNASKIWAIDIFSLCTIIEKFRNVKNESFEIKYHIDSLNKNYGFDEEMDDVIDFCKQHLLSFEEFLKKEGSFSHGDFTFGNIILKDDFYFIDPRYDRRCSSYLLDYAKLKMSIDGYESRFGIGKDNVGQDARDEFKKFLFSQGIFEIVVLLELMYVCRLYRYKDDKEKVKEFAKEVKKEIEGIK